MSAKVRKKGDHRMLELLHPYQSGPGTNREGLIPKFDCSKSSGFFVAE